MPPPCLRNHQRAAASLLELELPRINSSTTIDFYPEPLGDIPRPRAISYRGPCPFLISLAYRRPGLEVELIYLTVSSERMLLEDELSSSK